LKPETTQNTEQPANIDLIPNENLMTAEIDEIVQINVTGNRRHC